jgi:hypothetical protein
MGKTIRQIKEASSDLQHEIKKSGLDIKKDLNLTGLIAETKNDIQQPLDQYVSDLDNAIEFKPNRNSQIPLTPVLEVEASSESEPKIENDDKNVKD